MVLAYLDPRVLVKARASDFFQAPTLVEGVCECMCMSVSLHKE